MRKLSTIILLVAALPCKLAFAQTQSDTGVYVGGGLGYGSAGVGIAGIVAGLGRSGFTTVAASTDETSFGWKLFAGYQLHRNFAVEAGYADLGKFSAFAATIPAGTTTQTFESTGWSVDLLVIWPVANRFSLFLRGGALHSETKVKVQNTGFVRSRVTEGRDTAFSYKFGIGAGYDFTRSWRLRGEWERYNVSGGNGGHADVDFFSVSINYNF